MTTNQTDFTGYIKAIHPLGSAVSIVYRHYKNYDNPGIVSLWNTAMQGRGCCKTIKPFFLETQWFCKPWFDKGKAWNFKAVQRHVYVQHGNAFACFDELLDTHYSICRGSGMLRKEKGQWKLVQYVLSMTVPNDRIKETVAIKKELEKNVLDSLKTLKQNLNE